MFFLWLLGTAVIAVFGLLAFFFGRRSNIDPAGKPVCVTGAASGFGRCLTKELVQNGCFVFALDINEEALQREFGSTTNVQCIRCDVTSPESVAQAVAAMEKSGRGLYGLVNNAGIAPVPRALVETPEEDMQRTIGVNFFGMYRMTRACYPLLRAWGQDSPAAPRACIINVTSVAGLIAAPLMGPYTCSKHAGEAFSDCLRRELAPSGIRVSVVEPGFADTAILLSTKPDALRDLPRGEFYDRTMQACGFVNKKVKLLAPETIAHHMFVELFHTRSVTRQIIAWPWDKVVFYGYRFTPDWVSDWIMVKLPEFGRGRRKANSAAPRQEETKQE